jgi:hypothetical protein
MALVRCILGRFLGVVCHCFPPRLDVPTFATRCPHVHHDARDGGRWNYEREYCPVICRNDDFHAILGSFTCRKSTTWDRRLYFPSERRRAEDFLTLKNPTASAGFEPANLGTKGQHATPRPPKTLTCTYFILFLSIKLHWYTTAYSEDIGLRR